MTSMTRQYNSATSRARTAVDKTADFWTQGARTLTRRLPGLPQIDLIPAVERYFDFVQGTVDINRRLTIKLAWRRQARYRKGPVTGPSRPATSCATRPSRRATSCVTRPSRPSGPPARRPSRPNRPKQERAREARFAERRQARQAHDKARERYEGFTKAELSGQLAKRQLPKSGNVDDLIERLVEADSK